MAKTPAAAAVQSHLPAAPAPPADAVLAGVTASLAPALAPMLIEACEGRLSELTWFRTDWQRGGAATAKALWRENGGIPRRAVVKLPVNGRELTWMRRLSGRCASVPELLASGESLAQYDVAWIVIEHLPHGPLGGRWHEDHVARIAQAIALFASAASAFPLDREPRREEWEALLGQARDAVRINGLPERQRWTAAHRALGQRLQACVEEWEARQPLEWLHGDLHLANAMSRDGLDHGDVCLIDLAEVRPGHWVEDAVYLERQLWARPERLNPHKPVKAIADARRALGLENGEDYGRLANLRRAMLAATAPAFLKSEGAPAYLHACLERLEGSLAQLK